MPRVCVEFDSNGTPGTSDLVSHYTTTVGDGNQLDYVVDHNLDSSNVFFQATDVNTGEDVTDFTATRNSTNRATLRFDTAPALNAVRVLALGVRNGM